MKYFLYDEKFKPTDEEHAVVARILREDGTPSYFVDVSKKEYLEKLKQAKLKADSETLPSKQ